MHQLHDLWQRFTGRDPARFTGAVDLVVLHESDADRVGLDHQVGLGQHFSDAIALLIVMVRSRVSVRPGTRGLPRRWPPDAGLGFPPEATFTAISGPSLPTSVVTGTLSSTPPSTCRVPP